MAAPASNQDRRECTCATKGKPFPEQAVLTCDSEFANLQLDEQATKAEQGPGFAQTPKRPVGLASRGTTSRDHNSMRFVFSLLHRIIGRERGLYWYDRQ